MRIALVSQDMSHPQTTRLTWNKTILLVTGVFLLSGMLVMFWIAVLVMVYFALSGPALYRYTAVECHDGVRSGWVIHHACTCRQISSEARAQADCSLDGFALSPLLPLTRQGNWQLMW